MTSDGMAAVLDDDNTGQSAQNKRPGSNMEQLKTVLENISKNPLATYSSIIG